MVVMHTDHSPTQRILDTPRYTLYLPSFGLLNSYSHGMFCKKYWPVYADSAHQPHMIYKYSMQLCVATSIAMWYFTKNKKLVGNHTFVQAMCLSSFYHLGTCAFGSLILGKVVVLTACSLRIILYLYFLFSKAIVKTIRLVLTYIQKKVSKLQSSVAKAVMMSIQCW